MKKYLVLSEGKYWEADSLTGVVDITKNLDRCEVYNMTDADYVKAPKYIPQYNETRGELEVYDLQGNLVFSDNNADMVLSALDHSSDPDEDIYNLVEEYYTSELQEFGLD